MRTTLWRKNSLGIGTWTIWAEAPYLYYAHSVVEGGAQVTHKDLIETNNSGRSLEQQIELEMKSRISRQLDKGYKASREEAMLGNTNQLGLINPMLAKTVEQAGTSIDFRGAYVQPKYDGHRCLITRVGDDIIAYSRRGKLIHTISHLLEDIRKWIPDGWTLDGELYIPNKPLQTISSIIKREQPANKQLSFHWYDLVTDEPFYARWDAITDAHANHVRNPQIVLTPTFDVDDWGRVYELFRLFRRDGLEGAMLRRSIAGYQTGLRSAQLIKVKEKSDLEATCIAVRPSREGWGICTCRFTDAQGRSIIFDVSAPGNIGEKTQVLIHRDKYIGKQLTVEYAHLTNDGKPFHAVALRWRDDV